MSTQWWFGLVVTYLIHSTLFLGGCWLVVRFHRSVTPAFENRVWKLAALAGFLSTIAQVNLGTLPPVSLFTRRLAGETASPGFTSRRRRGN